MEVFVECQVFDGMFSDEAVVELGEKSFIVPKDSVRFPKTGNEGKVRARLVKNDRGEWLVLPTVYSDSIPSAGTRIVEE